MWYVYDVLYAVLYVRVSCFVVRGCAVSRRYINICNCDMFGVVNVYPNHFQFYVVCIDGQRYACCSECNVDSNECNEATSYPFYIFFFNGRIFFIKENSQINIYIIIYKYPEGDTNIHYVHNHLVEEDQLI